jgi:transcriptional regulator with XRE-family HTH domain
MKFETKLRILLAVRNFTNKEFSNLINVKEQSLSAYLAGRNAPSMETLVKMADFLKISTDFLINDKWTIEFVYQNDNKKLAVTESLPHYSADLPPDIKELFQTILAIAKDRQKKKELQKIVKQLTQD